VRDDYGNFLNWKILIMKLFNDSSDVDKSEKLMKLFDNYNRFDVIHFEFMAFGLNSKI